MSGGAETVREKAQNKILRRETRSYIVKLKYAVFVGFYRVLSAIRFAEVVTVSAFRVFGFGKGRKGRKRHTVNGFLCNSAGIEFKGGPNDLLEDGDHIRHSCPFCGEDVSRRLGICIGGILIRCVEIGKGRYIRCCYNCRQFLQIPSGIFVETLLERFKGITKVWNYTIQQMRQEEVLVPNWCELIFEANANGPIDFDSLEYDGKGTCPGCGYDEARVYQHMIPCPSCRGKLGIHQEDISRSGNTNVMCYRCGGVVIIPPTVWCPNCGHNIVTRPLFEKLIEQANCR